MVALEHSKNVIHTYNAPFSSGNNVPNYPTNYDGVVLDAFDVCVVGVGAARKNHEGYFRIIHGIWYYLILWIWLRLNFMF